MATLTPETLTTIATLATAGALIVALVFGAIQVRHAREQRRLAVTVEVIRTMQSPDVIRPARAVMGLPFDTPPERIHGDEDLQTLVDSTIIFYEGYGMLVYSRVVDLHDLDRASGGAVRGSWRRLRPYIEWSRAHNHEPNFGEWLQWLAERMEADPAPGKAVGAHIAFRDWKR